MEVNVIYFITLLASFALLTMVMLTASTGESPLLRRGLLMESIHHDQYFTTHPRNNQPSPYKQGIAALNTLMCDDKGSLQYFYWRKDWHWPHCPFLSPFLHEERLGRKVIKGKVIIPIFVIFNDKVTDLKEFFRSLHASVQSSFQVVILETGSNLPEAIAYVDWLRLHQVPVIYVQPIMNNAFALNNIGPVIQKYMLEHSESLFYVTTDPDLSLHGVRENILEVFSDILTEFPDVPVVGPALRIDDLPSNAYSNKLWIGKEGAAGWEIEYWPDAMNSIYQAHRKQRIYYSHHPIDSTFGMYRRTSVWGRLNKGYRIAAPYEMRHVDWYYSPVTGVPKDIVEYTCLNRSTAVTHFQLSDCSKWLAHYQIKPKAKEVILTDERQAIFDLKRLEHVIGRQTPLSIRIGSLPTDYKRFIRSNSRADSNGSLPYWVEVSPNINSFWFTDRHMMLPYLAVPFTNQSADIAVTKLYIADEGVPVCDSLFPTRDANISQSRERFVEGYAQRCQRIEQDLLTQGKSISMVDMKAIQESKTEDTIRFSYACVKQRSATTRRALPLSFIFKHLVHFPIRKLHIVSKAADRSLLFSIVDYLPMIQQIRCECQRGAWYHNTTETNSCDAIVKLLETHNFMIDFIRLKNCGLEEYYLKATKKQ